MHPAVLLGTPAAAVVTAFTLGMVRRRRVERRASICEALALAARRAVPLHVPLLRAAGVARGKRAAALRAVAADLESGRPLGETLRARLAREFPAAVAASITAGETSSRLPEALDAAAVEASRDLARGHRMALAAFYPALLLIGVAALNLLILEGHLRYWQDSDSGEAVVLWPVVLVRWALYGVVGAVAALLLWRRARAPVSGVAAARFLRTAAIALDAGRPLHGALATAASTAGAPRLSRAAIAAARALAAGDAPAEAWSSLPIPRSARERLASAAPTRLTSVLREVADLCDEREARRADRFIRWSVPAATALAGLLVAVDYAALIESWANSTEMARPW